MWKHILLLIVGHFIYNPFLNFVMGTNMWIGSTSLEVGIPSAYIYFLGKLPFPPPNLKKLQLTIFSSLNCILPQTHVALNGIEGLFE